MPPLQTPVAPMIFPIPCSSALVRMTSCQASHTGDMPEITLDADAYQAMLDYDFPGNVRELENILQRAVTLAEGDSITLADIRLQPSSGEPSAESRPQSSASEQRIETNNLEAYLENIERSAITQALEATRWNKTAAAEKLGISFRALRYRCKKLGID